MLQHMFLIWKTTFKSNLNMNQVCNYETIQGIQQFGRSYIFFSNLQLHMNATRIAFQST
jgi:hypothetical protein